MSQCLAPQSTACDFIAVPRPISCCFFFPTSPNHTTLVFLLFWASHSNRTKYFVLPEVFASHERVENLMTATVRLDLFDEHWIKLNEKMCIKKFSTKIIQGELCPKSKIIFSRICVVGPVIFGICNTQRTLKAIDNKHYLPFWLNYTRDTSCVAIVCSPKKTWQHTIIVKTNVCWRNKEITRFYRKSNRALCT